MPRVIAWHGCAKSGEMMCRPSIVLTALRLVLAMEATGEPGRKNAVLEFTNRAKFLQFEAETLVEDPPFFRRDLGDLATSSSNSYCTGFRCRLPL